MARLESGEVRCGGELALTKKQANNCEIGFVGGGDHRSLVTMTKKGSDCEIGP